MGRGSALPKARLKVFNDGRYLWGDDEAPSTLAKLDALVTASRKKRNSPGIECGCLLDVTGVDAEPGYGLTGPFSDEALVKVLGTARPSRRVFKQKGDDLFELLDRGQCGHLLLWKDGKPSHVAFLGMPSTTGPTRSLWGSRNLAFELGQASRRTLRLRLRGCEGDLGVARAALSTSSQLVRSPVFRSVLK